jgi:hypothetical protein
MKLNGIHLIFLMALMLSNSCANSSQKDSGKTSLISSDTGKAIIGFKEYEHDFGKVVEGEKVGFIFTFENNGTGDLVIMSATTSCGCTVPKYDTNPISPGKSGNLEVIFDSSGKNGMQTKAITIKSNALTPVVLLKVTAEVITSNNN